MNKYFNIILLLFSINTIYSSQIKDGFYIGFGLGYDYYNCLENTSFIEQPDARNYNCVKEKKTLTDGLVGRIFIGYLSIIENTPFAYAVEAFWEKANNKLNSSYLVEYSKSLHFKRHYELNSHMNWSLGGLFKPGYIINDSMFLHAVLGFKYTQYALIKKENDYVSNSQKEKRFNDMLVDTTENIFGIVYGLGIESQITETSRVGVELTNTNYQKINITDKHSENTSFKPKESTLIIKYTYIL